MNLIVTSNPHGFTLFMWIISLLTLSATNDIKTDGKVTLNTSSLKGSYNDTSSKINHEILSSTIASEFEYTNTTEVSSKIVTISSIAGEGGPISIDSTAETTLPSASHVASSINNSRIQTNLPNVKDNASIAITRGSAVSKIVPRKGANQVSDVKKEDVTSRDKLSFDEAKPIIDSSKEITDNQTHKDHTNNNANNLKPSINDKLVNNTSNINSTSSLQHTSILQQNSSTTTTATVSIKEHKAKPTVTIPGPNNDKQILSLLAKGPHVGISKKIDYVLPVIITLISLPALGAIIFMIYKQGRDCWDKRHYRRMDFLIDGMYND